MRFGIRNARTGEFKDIAHSRDILDQDAKDRYYFIHSDELEAMNLVDACKEQTPISWCEVTMLHDALRDWEAYGYGEEEERTVEAFMEWSGDSALDFSIAVDMLPLFPSWDSKKEVLDEYFREAEIEEWQRDYIDEDALYDDWLEESDQYRFEASDGRVYAFRY